MMIKDSICRLAPETILTGNKEKTLAAELLREEIIKTKSNKRIHGINKQSAK